MKEFLRKSWEKHPILWNFLCIIVSLMLLGYLSLWFLDLWTHHGSTTKVPDVIGMSLSDGVEELRDADLEVVISDSVYTKAKRPGSIVDVIPRPESVVKAGREVYITIVAFSPEPIIIDMLLLDTSAKQAEAYLKSKGLKVEKRYVPAEYSDVVVGIKCKGRNLSVGSRVTVDDVIILEIGERRGEETVSDPLDIMIDASLDYDQATEQEDFSEEVEVSPEAEEE